MAKSKKKKNKNADFVKPKLKVGKKKPNATNTTNIAFKSSAINVLSQLEEKSEPTNQRNLTLKDILNQLTHYNDHTRQDATQALKDFFIQHPSLLHQNLSVFIQKFLGRSVDSSFSVRQNFISCLEHVLRNVSDQEILPFFSIMMAHLSCAMTHINEDIQADSLKFLELCLDLFPELFLGNCDKVLHNFLDLISHKQISVAGKKHDSKGISQVVNRELSVKPSGRMSAVKTRNDILQKLLKIVSLVFRTDSEEDKGLDQVKDIEVENSLNYVLLKYGLFDTDKSTHLFSRTESGRFTEATDATNKTRLLIKSFMPILFNCWNDANPSTYSIPSPEKTNQTSLSTMVAIVSIMRKVSSYEKQRNQTESFAELYFKDFIKNIVNFFPFSMVNATQGKTKKKEETDSDADLIQLNMDICNIYCKSVAHNLESMNQTMKYMRIILQYIVTLIADLSGKDLIGHMDCIREILNLLLRSSICIEIESQGKEELVIRHLLCKILNGLCSIYKDTRSFNVRCTLLPVLEDLLDVVEERPIKVLMEIFQKWVCLLPRDLQETESDKSKFLLKVVALISKALIQGQRPTELFVVLSRAIINVTGSSRSFLSGNQSELQRSFIGMVYNLPVIEKDLTESLTFVCHRDDINITVKKHIIHVLYCCCQKKTTMHLSLFLSFATSVILGYSMKNFEKLQQRDGDSEMSETKRLKYKIISGPKEKTGREADLQEHMELSKFLLDMLLTIDCEKQLLDILLPTLDRLLTKFTTLPDVAALGLLKLFERTLTFCDATSKEMNMEFYQKLNEFLFAVIVTKGTKNEDSVSGHDGQITNWISLAVKLLDSDEFFLAGILKLYLSACSDSLLEDSVIASGLWHFRRDVSLHEKLTYMLRREEFQGLNLYIDKIPLFVV